MRNPFSKKASDAPPAEPDVTPIVTPAAPDGKAVAEPALAPEPTLTDEGVRYEAIGTDIIVNRAADSYDAHRRELHIQGRAFVHVSEAAGGAWIYRQDT